MRQRTLGIAAAAFLLAGAALTAGTAVYAHLASPSGPAVAREGPQHRDHRPGPGGRPAQVPGLPAPPARPNV